VAIRVISLEGSAQRREAMAARLAALGLAFRFFPAVDGRRLSPDDKTRDYSPSRSLRLGLGYVSPLSDPELGCALSHLAVCRSLLAERLPAALVLEDDAVAGPSLPPVLDALAEAFPADRPAVVLLTWAKNYYPASRRPLRDGIDLVRMYGASYAAGYFLTRAAAAILAERLHPVWTRADDWRRFRGFVPLYGLDPHVISHDDGQASTIALGGDRRVNRPKRRWWWLQRPDWMVRRVWYRLGEWGHRLRHRVKRQPRGACRLDAMRRDPAPPRGP